MLIEGQVERGLTLGQREVTDKCFLYLLQKKKTVTFVLLNDYVLKHNICVCAYQLGLLSACLQLQH